MKFSAIHFNIHSGEDLTIRETNKEDALRLIDFIKKNLSTTDFIPLYPDEFKNTIEQQQVWIDGYSTIQFSLLLVVEYNAEIIANIDLTIHSREMMRHSGLIGMSVLEEWRGRGIGRKLLDVIFEYAIQSCQIEILWLQVFDTNESAVHLYQKMGFEETGYQK